MTDWWLIKARVSIHTLSQIIIHGIVTMGIELLEDFQFTTGFSERIYLGFVSRWYSWNCWWGRVTDETEWPWARCSLMMGTWRFSDEYMKVQCTFILYLKLSKKLQDGHPMNVWKYEKEKCIDHKYHNLPVSKYPSPKKEKIRETTKNF